MDNRNISPKMFDRFKKISFLIEEDYIEPVKPIHHLLPSLCYIPAKTAAFKNAPAEVRRKTRFLKGWDWFSWYAFFLGPFAFTQTGLAKDYFIIYCLYNILTALIPYNFHVDSLIYTVFSVLMSYAFIFSRYYQYQQNGFCPTNKKAYSTIGLAFIYMILASIPGGIISLLLYPNVEDF